MRAFDKIILQHKYIYIYRQSHNARANTSQDAKDVPPIRKLPRRVERFNKYECATYPSQRDYWHAMEDFFFYSQSKVLKISISPFFYTIEMLKANVPELRCAVI